MRWSEEQIKQAILHPEQAVRQLAVNYFCNSFSRDKAVLPLIIEALEKYGHAESPYLLCDARNIPQTGETVAWCMDRLREDVGDDLEWQKFQLEVSWALAAADPELLQEHLAEIIELPGFEAELCADLQERVLLFSESPESLWQELEIFCERDKSIEFIDELADLPRALRVVEALARHGEPVAERALSLLETTEEIEDYTDNPLTIMEGLAIRLAGEMRLASATGLLIKKFHTWNEWLIGECERALTKIGTENVAKEFTKDAPLNDWDYVIWLSSLLGNIHTDFCVEKSLELLESTTDEELKTLFGEAAVSHFATEAVEPVRNIIKTVDFCPDVLELRNDLVASATALEIEFPEYEQWKRESQDEEFFEQLVADTIYDFAPTINVDGAEWDADDDEWEDDEIEEEFADDKDYESPSILAPIVRDEPKVGRNAPCPCGSGKKFKKCCMNKPQSDPLLQ